MYPHTDPPPGARLQRGLQPRWQAPRQWLLRQMCPHLEHSDGCFSPQLPRDRRDLRGVLERHRGQSRSQRVRRIGLCTRPEEMTYDWGSHGPTTNVYIAKMTVPACPPHCCSPIRCHGPPLQPTGALPPSYVHTRTTHTVFTHMHQTYNRSAWTFVLLHRPETFLCYHIVETCWTHHKRTKTPGFFLLSSFYPLYQNCKDFCSLLVCAYCICQHLVSCGHCYVELGFY